MARQLARTLGAVAACASLLAMVSIASTAHAAATSGPCPMAGSCTLKSAEGLYLTWDATRQGSSSVYLASKPSVPGAFWNLGYDGFEIKVGTVGRTLCLGAVARRDRRPKRYGVDLSRCTGRRGQAWTLVGTRTFGSHVAIRSNGHLTMCLTVQRSGSRSKRTQVVLEGCAGAGSKDQAWST